MITFKRGEVIKLPLKRTFDRVFLTPEIAKQIIPREVLPGTNLSSLTGCLQVKDNLHDLKAFEEPLSDQPGHKRPCAPTQEEVFRKTKYEWGQVDVDLFIKKLMQEGINDVKIEHCGGGTTKIRILSDDTLITISENSTHIHSNGKEKLRLKLRDLLMKCVPNF